MFYEDLYKAVIFYVEHLRIVFMNKCVTLKKKVKHILMREAYNTGKGRLLRVFQLKMKRGNWLKKNIANITISTKQILRLQISHNIEEIIFYLKSQ